MGNSYFLAAFVGWLLVQVSGAVGDTVYFMMGKTDTLTWLPNFLSFAVALVGWVVTVTFAVPIIKSAFRSLIK